MTPYIRKHILSRIWTAEEAFEATSKFVLKQLKIPTLPQTPRTELKYFAETLNRSYLTFGLIIYVIGSTIVSSNSAQDIFLFALPGLVAITFYLFRLKERAEYDVRHPEDVNFEREFVKIINMLDGVTDEKLSVQETNVVQVLGGLLEQRQRLLDGFTGQVVDAVQTIQADEPKMPKRSKISELTGAKDSSPWDDNA